MRWLGLLIIAVLVLAYWWPRLKHLAARVPPGRPQRDELVKDPVCQTYVVLSRAIRSEEQGVPVHFCSRECAERYARGERRA